MASAGQLRRAEEPARGVYHAAAVPGRGPARHEARLEGAVAQHEVKGVAHRRRGGQRGLRALEKTHAGGVRRMGGAQRRAAGCELRAAGGGERRGGARGGAAAAGAAAPPPRGSL